MRWRPAVMALALVTGACAGDGSSERELARPSSSTTPTTRARPTSTVPIATTTTGAPSTTAPVGAGLVLGPEGLGAVTFGEEAEKVLAELERLLGPPSDDGTLGSCPSGEINRLVQFAELAVLIGEREGASRFVGWDLGEASGALPPLVTAEGIGVGARVAELRAAYAGRVEVGDDDPFGPSFDVRVPPPGRLRGTLTGAGPTDAVATLAGGTATCAS